MLIIVTEPCGCLPWGRHRDSCSCKRWEREIDVAIKKLLVEFKQALKEK